MKRPRPDDLRTLIENWADLESIASIQPMPPGLSGAVVYRVLTKSGHKFVLKGWPSRTSASRIAEIHRIAEFVRANGCEEVPAVAACDVSRSSSGQVANPLDPPGHPDRSPIPNRRSIPAQKRKTVVSFGGRCWDLVRWCDGEPLPAHAEPERIGLGASTIARFHAASRKIPDGQLSPQTIERGLAGGRRVPAVAVRLQRIAEIDRLIPRIASAARATGDLARVGVNELGQRPLSRSIDRAVQLLLDRWSAASWALTRSLMSFDHVRLDRQLVLRDVHREHLLFSDPTEQQGSDADTMPHVTGLIDLDAARIDTPATDLARWVAGFLAVSSPGGIDPLPGRNSLIVPDSNLAGVGSQTGGSNESSRDDAVWQSTFAAYRQVLPLSREEERLARELLGATAWVSLANWVDWVCLEKRSFDARPEILAARIDWLVCLADKSSVR